MPASWSTIDCDVHANVPSMQALLPYLDEQWRDSVIDRGLNSLESINYPPNAPLTARADWRGKSGAPASSVDTLLSVPVLAVRVMVSCPPLESTS